MRKLNRLMKRLCALTASIIIDKYIDIEISERR